MESKLKVIMKKSFLKYENEVINVNALIDFIIIMDEIITKLNCLKDIRIK